MLFVAVEHFSFTLLLLRKKIEGLLMKVAQILCDIVKKFEITMKRAEKL